MKKGTDDIGAVGFGSSHIETLFASVCCCFNHLKNTKTFFGCFVFVKTDKPSHAVLGLPVVATNQADKASACLTHKDVQTHIDLTVAPLKSLPGHTPALNNPVWVEAAL